VDDVTSDSLVGRGADLEILGQLATSLLGRVTGVDDRAAHNRRGMEQTLERLAAAAEPLGRATGT
jgi:hypothetical protein